MSFIETVTDRCVLPTLDDGPIEVTMGSIPDELSVEEQVLVMEASLGEAEGVVAELREIGLQGEIIGFGRISAGLTLVEASSGPVPFWLFAYRIGLRPCGDSVIARLGRAGFEIDRREVRLAYATPADWHPLATMVPVGPNTLRGEIPEARPVLAVPVMPGSSRFGLWISIDLDATVF